MQDQDIKTLTDEQLRNHAIEAANSSLQFIFELQARGYEVISYLFERYSKQANDRYTFNVVCKKELK